MDTPIYDFIKAYSEAEPLRFHMPGHKGVPSYLNVEPLDITEINGADNLWDDSKHEGIIARSEENASKLFGCKTFYSTQGSSLCIRAMLFLIKKWALLNNEAPFIIAGRNAHKTFINTSAMLDIVVEYIMGDETESYMSCNISPDRLDSYLKNAANRPTAVYITSPDYLGNVADIKGLSKVCKDNGCFLIVDNAHGAYTRFLNEDSLFPIDNGALMCCSSAHKSLPVLTGGAYLHINMEADEFFLDNAKSALSLFASTSPSYLILASLDLCNRYMAERIRDDLSDICALTDKLKRELSLQDYYLVGKEKLKLSIDTKKYGYTGYDFAKLLEDENIIPEHVDEDFVVFMISSLNTSEDIGQLEKCLLSIPKKEAILKRCFDGIDLGRNERVLSPYEAMMSRSELIRASDAYGRILAEPALSCPPCVALCMAGERIGFVPEGIEYIRVVKE